MHKCVERVAVLYIVHSTFVYAYESNVSCHTLTYVPRIYMNAYL